MLQFTQHIYRLICIAAFVFGIFNSALAQENLKYQGPLTVGGYKGDADYSYRISDADTLFDGAFRLKRANLDALLQKQDYTFDFSGNFKDNYPNGFWKFQFGEFQSNNESQVVDYQYRVAISGVQEEATGRMSLGRPDGTWEYTVNRIEDSEVAEILFKSTIIFDKGVPQRNFRIENDNLTLAGRFLRNGLAHDTWSLFESSGFGADESWFFNDGLLQKISIESGGSINETFIYNKYTGQTKIINLDSRYNNALAVYQFAMSNSDNEIGGKMQSLLSDNAAYYKKIDDILSKLGESSFLPEFKVKVPYFPFNDEEKQQVAAIIKYYESAEEISSAFLEDTQLNILKLSDKDAAFQYKVIQKIADDFLNPIGQLLEYQKQEVAEFAPREELIRNLWSSNELTTNIDIPIDSTGSIRSFQLGDSKEFDFSGNDVKTVLQIVEYASKSLDAIKGELQKKLANEKREQKLVAFEEQLISQRNALHLLIDSVITESPASNRKALEKLKEHADTALSAYSALNDVEVKLARAQKLAVCYDQLQVLAENIASLPSQEEAIKEKYLDRVWNPFMANLMDEEVKKRITVAYRKIVVPYFLKQASTEFKCTEAEALNVLMKHTYQRMLELRVENTSKLERKLRKVNDPHTVLELFELQPIDKEQ